MESVSGPFREVNLTTADQAFEAAGLSPSNLPDTSSDIDDRPANITPDYQAVCNELLDKNTDLFASSDKELGKFDLVKMTIDTGNHSPIRQKPYRLPLSRKHHVREQVKTMLDAGFIEPSTSSWSSPIVLVPKKDGTLRFCVDFRALNAVTKVYYWPLPHIDDLLSSLDESTIFSCLDL